MTAYMVRLFSLLLLLLSAVPLQAQLIGPVTTSSRLTWEQGAVSTSAEAQALEYRFRADGGAYLVVPGVTCTGTTAPFACTAALTSPMVSLLNLTGQHSVTLSAYAGGTVGLESTQSIPFVLKAPPAVPMGLSITK